MKLELIEELKNLDRQLFKNLLHHSPGTIPAGECRKRWNQTFWHKTIMERIDELEKDQPDGYKFSELDPPVLYLARTMDNTITIERKNDSYCWQHILAQVLKDMQLATK